MKTIFRRRKNIPYDILHKSYIDTRYELVEARQRADMLKSYIETLEQELAQAEVTLDRLRTELYKCLEEDHGTK